MIQKVCGHRIAIQNGLSSRKRVQLYYKQMSACMLVYVFVCSSHIYTYIHQKKGRELDSSSTSRVLLASLQVIFHIYYIRILDMCVCLCVVFPFVCIDLAYKKLKRVSHII